MDILQATQAASQDERFGPVLSGVQDELSDVAPEQVDELIKLLEFALKQPDAYPQIRAAAERDDMVEPGDLPEEFDAQLLMAVLVVLYKLRDRPSADQMVMRRGGLARVRTLASRGRMGDTMLAHISPEEAALLKARGGAGTLNPDTGLPQYFSLKKLFKAVLPIALNFIVPGLGAAIGTALGATGTAAAMIGQAVIGGATAGLTGGNVLQGAVLGGLGGGLGGAAGSAASDALGLGLGQTGQQILGGALVGGATGAATGQGFGRGALMGAAGAGLGTLAQGVGEGALGAGIGAGGRTAGNMLTAGFSPKEALAGGALTGLATGMMQRPAAGPGLKPSQLAVESMRSGATGGPADAPVDYSLTRAPAAGAEGVAGSGSMSVRAQSPLAQAGDLATQGVTSAGLPMSESMVVSPGAQLPTNVGSARPPAAPSSPLKTLGQLAALSSLAGARPPAAQQAIQQLNPAQQEYFNRPSIQWDWNRMQNDANARNMTLGQFMATYWPQVTSGAYNAPTVKKPPASTAPAGAGLPGMPPTTPPPDEAPPNGYAYGGYAGGGYAGGGGLGAVARYVQGGGTGREDAIDARLSDGEYVMDAETVAMLGDGSNRAGARKLDAFREQIRRHKGRAMSRGKFSPNAKQPAAYLKGK